MKEIDIAYFAGLFEGEGSLGRGGNQKVKNRTYICVDMTDEDIVRKCQTLFGGLVYGPSYKNGNGHNIKPMYQWRIHKQKEVWPILDAIYPLLGKRRKEQIDDARIRRDNYIDMRVK